MVLLCAEANAENAQAGKINECTGEKNYGTARKIKKNGAARKNGSQHGGDACHQSKAEHGE